jgi:hypothetical protein
MEKEYPKPLNSHYQWQLIRGQSLRGLLILGP